MKTPDSPDWHHDIPEATAPEFGLPSEELVQQGIHALPHATPSQDLIPAGEDGLDTGDLMEPPSLEGKMPTSKPETAELPSDNVPVAAKKDEPGEEPEETQERPDASKRPEGAESRNLPATAGGGEGAGGGPPDVPAGETSDEGGERSINHEFQQCLDDIQRIREIMATTDEPLSIHEAGKLNNAFLELAKTAGNTAGVRHYLDQMIHPDPAETVEGYVIRSDSGDEEAWDDLHRHLLRESRASFDALRSEGKKEPQPHFDAIVSLCETQGVPVDPYIDTVAEAAPTPEAQAITKQHLFLQHASRVIPNEGAYADDVKEDIKERAKAIATNLSDDRLLEDGPYAMLAVTDRELRGQLFDRYCDQYFNSDSLRSFKQGDLTAIKVLFKVAPDLPKAVDFKPSMGRSVGLLLDIGIRVVREDEQEQAAGKHEGRISDKDRGELLRRRAEAKVILNLYAEAPENAAETCKRAAEETKGNKFQLGLFGPGELERLCINEYMKTGDIASARRLVEDTKGLEPDQVWTHRATLHACWDAATTTEQMDELRPTPLLKDMLPHIDIEFEYRRACLSNDTKYLTGLIKGLSERGFPAPKLPSPAQATGMLTKRLATLDPEAGQKLAYDTLRTLHTRYPNIDISELYPFYDVLAKSNDPDRLAMARQSIRLADGSDAGVLNELAKLASALARRTTPGKRNT